MLKDYIDNYDKLETERQSYLLKIYSLILAYIGLLTWVIYACINNIIKIQNVMQDIRGIFAILATRFLILMDYVIVTGSLFEKKKKKVLLPSLLKDIAGRNGKINWGEEIYDEKIKMSPSEWNSMSDEEFDKLCEKYEDFDYDEENQCINIIKYPESTINLFNQERGYNYDDIFWGTYYDVPFKLTEYKNRFNTIIIEIPFNIRYQGKLVIADKNLLTNEIVKGLSPINIDAGFSNTKLNIFTDNPTGTEEILTPRFINFVNSLDKKYSFAFTKGFLYIIYNNNRDYFKMGSLYKKIDDESQYEKFRQDMEECLDIVLRAGKIGWEIRISKN